MSTLDGLLGAFIVARYPRHLVGWLFVLSGLVRAIAAAAEAWWHPALVIEPGALPGGPVALVMGVARPEGPWAGLMGGVAVGGREPVINFGAARRRADNGLWAAHGSQ